MSEKENAAPPAGRKRWLTPATASPPAAASPPAMASPPALASEKDGAAADRLRGFLPGPLKKRFGAATGPIEDDLVESNLSGETAAAQDAASPGKGNDAGVRVPCNVA